MEERELRMRLSYWLQGEGACQEDGWLAAFQNVPRHLFVPQGWFPGRNGSPIRSQDMTAKEWLETVYHDGAIFIRDDGLSSSSAPVVVARMLDFLHVEDGNTVLEIGTGSGYEAALLCHRLGGERVTSIDRLADLVDCARERLREIGYEPHLATSDGLAGYPARAPYDRVLGTCYAWPIPTAWIQQTQPGGRVVAVSPDGCVGLNVWEDGSASGRLHPERFSFMPMVGYMPDFPREFDPAELRGETRQWRHPPAVLAAGGQAQASFAALALTVLVRDPHRWDRQSELHGLLDKGDGSWVRFHPERREVTQGGRRRLWTEVEILYGEWCKLGAPNRERFGLTVEPDGRHMVWLDSADSEHRWEVRAGR